MVQYYFSYVFITGDPDKLTSSETADLGLHLFKKKSYSETMRPTAYIFNKKKSMSIGPFINSAYQAPGDQTGDQLLP